MAAFVIRITRSSFLLIDIMLSRIGPQNTLGQKSTLLSSAAPFILFYLQFLTRYHQLSEQNSQDF